MSLAALVFSFLSSFAVSKVEADKLYTQENYAEAAEAYQAVLQSGVAAEVYYNLGNCYYKLDKIAMAILNYERALLLAPADADIRANLALARGKTVDKVIPPSEMFFVTWWRNLTNSMSIDAWSTLGLAAFVVILLGLLAYMFATPLWARKLGVYGAMALFLFMLVANLAALSQYAGLKHHDTAIVLSPAVSVKSSPSERSTDLFLIHEGSKVEILDNSMKDWIEVKFEEGKQGWIPTNTAEVI